MSRSGASGVVGCSVAGRSWSCSSCTGGAGFGVKGLKPTGSLPANRLAVSQYQAGPGPLRPPETISFVDTSTLMDLLAHSLENPVARAICAISNCALARAVGLGPAPEWLHTGRDRPLHRGFSASPSNFRRIPGEPIRLGRASRRFSGPWRLSASCAPSDLSGIHRYPFPVYRHIGRSGFRDESGRSEAGRKIF